VAGKKSVTGKKKGVVVPENTPKKKTILFSKKAGPNSPKGKEGAEVFQSPGGKKEKKGRADSKQKWKDNHQKKIKKFGTSRREIEDLK